MKLKKLLPIGIIAMMLFMVLSLSVSAYNTHDDERVQDILTAQLRSEPLHEALRSANETVERLQSEIEFYNKKAANARESLCNTPETCTVEYLDPAGKGVNVDNYLKRQ